MIVDLPTPCFGKSELFDSTHLADHVKARALCDTCPELETCKTELENARKTAHPGWGPEGTWAGQRVAGPARRRTFTADELAAQDARYTDLEMKQANSQYKAGVRTQWVIEGHRAYERNRKRRAKQHDTDTAA